MRTLSSLLARLGTLGTVVALGVTACGGGVDEPPCTNCDVKARTTVKWSFNAYPDRGFLMDSCVDFKVGKVAVDVVDADGYATSGVEMCGNAQTVFQGLAPGDYTVYLMPLDFDDVPLLANPATATVTATDVNTEATVNVAWDQWLGGPFTGTYLFRLSWGGMSCEATDVKNQVVTLTVNGVVQNLMTDDGQMLNGSDKKPCKKLSDNFPQSVLGAAFGPATILVEGFDATDNMKYSKQFDTFVGAGITNPTMTFDIPTQ
jgi:hypothetical protein